MQHDILKLQRAAGLVLQETCTVLQISREDFCSVLARCLHTELQEQEKAGPEEETLLRYFREFPQKYLAKRYNLFRNAFKNSVQALCDGEDLCTVNKATVSDSWNKHGEEILRLFDEIHRRAIETQTETLSSVNRQIIKELLSM